MMRETRNGGRVNYVAYIRMLPIYLLPIWKHPCGRLHNAIP